MNCLTFALNEFAKNPDLLIFYNGDHVIVRSYDKSYDENGPCAMNSTYMELTEYGYEHIMKSFRDVIFTDKLSEAVTNYFFKIESDNAPAEAVINLTTVVPSLNCSDITLTIDEDDALPSCPVNNPSHYGGLGNTYEVIKVIEAWDLGYHLGNTVKYIGRAGKKDPGKLLEDLKKARWYLDRKIMKLEETEKK